MPLVSCERQTGSLWELSKKGTKEVVAEAMKGRTQFCNLLCNRGYCFPSDCVEDGRVASKDQSRSRHVTGVQIQ